MVGLDGNSFSIMGAFSKAARRQHWSDKEIKEVLDDAMSGDRDHLMQVILSNTVPPGGDDE